MRRPSILPGLPFLWRCLGGLIFLAVFFAAYGSIPSDFYQARDDGIITMSHARNLVEHHFIGVNPSGPRVEGYSAPLQLFVFAIVYAVTGIGYLRYAAVQTVFCTFLLGFLFFFLLEGRDRLSRLVALGLTVLAAVFLVSRTSFLMWHGSGMENAITHCAFLGTVAVLAGFVERGRVRYAWSLVPFLAAISRVEGIFPIGLLLLAFALFWLWRKKNPAGLAFLLAVLGLWVVFQGWRFLYFGALLPNTAVAQATELRDRLSLIGQFHREYLSTSFRLSEMLLSFHGIDVLLPFLFLLIVSRRDERTVFLLTASIALIVSALLYPFFFGRTLLDPARTTTYAPVFVALGVVAILASCAKRRKALLWAGPVLLALAVLMSANSHRRPTYLCCSATGFETIHEEVLAIATAESIPRPTVANADLGVMSWHKDCNVVDIGMLGSPIVSRMQFGPLLADYLFDYMAPDIIECHGNWIGRYRESIFEDKRFAEMYQPVRIERAERPDPENGDIASGIWIRKAIREDSGSAERRLIDDLRADPSVERLNREIESCRANSVTETAYVARAAYRFLPEFRKAGRFGPLRQWLKTQGRDGFFRYVADGPGEGHANGRFLRFLLTRYLESELGSRIEDAKPIIASRFKVFLGRDSVIYLKMGCSIVDRRSRFFLEYVAAEGDGRRRREEFHFRTHGYEIGEWCVVVEPLPERRLQAIRTGAFIPDEKAVWEASWSARADRQ